MVNLFHIEIYSFYIQNFQAIQASYISSYLYQQTARQQERNEQLLDEPDKRNVCLIFLAMQLLLMDCLPLGEYILSKLLDDTADEKVNAVRAAYLIKNGQVGDFTPHFTPCTVKARRILRQTRENNYMKNYKSLSYWMRNNFIIRLSVVLSFMYFKVKVFWREMPSEALPPSGQNRRKTV